MTFLSDLGPIFGLTITANLLYLALPGRDDIRSEVIKANSFLRENPVLWDKDQNGEIVEIDPFQIEAYRDLTYIAKLTGEDRYWDNRANNRKVSLKKTIWPKFYVHLFKDDVDFKFTVLSTLIAGFMTICGVVDKIGWTPLKLQKSNLFTSSDAQALGFILAVCLLTFTVFLFFARHHVREKSWSFMSRVFGHELYGNDLDTLKKWEKWKSL